MSKLRITPLGSCRVNTPLKRAAVKYPIELETRGIYGYVHSSDEALQQIRVLQGEKQFRPEVLPIIGRPNTSSEAGVGLPADLNVVEISSAKLVRSGDDAVQINYLYRHFDDFFADGRRTIQFWSLIKKRDEAGLLAFLDSENTFQQLSAEDRALLTSLSMEQQSFDQLKQDMAEIVERFGRDKLLFVTHVNATTPDGNLVPARDRLIRWVKRSAEQIGVPCFDPSETMREFGQERAMERGGLDLTHYTPAFSDRVFAQMNREHIAELLESGPYLSSANDEGVRLQIMADNIASLIDFDFKAGSKKLFEALRQAPRAGPLIQLRGTVLSRIGDYDNAVRDFRDEAVDELTHEARVGLLEALVHTSGWDEALKLAKGLLADEYESTAIYEGAASASERLGRDEDALTYWKQAFRHDRSNFRAALNALTLIDRLSTKEQAADWKREIVNNAGGSHGDGMLEVAQWALANHEDELFAKAFGAVAGESLARAEDLLQSAANAGMDGAVAKSLQLAATLPDRTSARRHFRGVAAQMVEKSADLLEQGDMQPAFDLAHAAHAVTGSGPAGRIARDVTRHYYERVRDAYGRDDFPAVVSLAAEAGEIIFQAPRLGTLVGISLSRLDHGDEAREVFVRLRQLYPDDVAVQRWSGRLAQIGGDFTTALRAYGTLARSNDPAAERFKAETGRFFERAGRRAISQMRELGRERRFAEAIALAEAIRDETDIAEQVATELERLHRLLRLRLREIEQGEGEIEDREPILRMMERINPDDEAVLRRLALEFMRQFRFGEAARCWERLDALNPDNASVVRNRQRCEILAGRSGPVIAEAAA